jgi:class 3 adenylate cyclase/tetratricopeptide (TPR) repeat protein
MAARGARAAISHGSMGNTMKGIAEWLASIGLSEYAQRFADNAIDLSVLRDLTEQDLKELGVLLGHRRRILRAIAELDGVAPEPTETATAPALRKDAERRHLTVMICDLVGSTALSARLDPEDMNAVMDAYHAACARIMLTYDGAIGEFRGDGILAYFGYPRAHEDDAERTVRAGLEIIAAVARLETRAAEPLAVRIGIATGLVVVGDLSSESALREHALVGETPNLAARLQALAEPGTIVVAASTRRLLGDLFRLRDLGQHEVKGVTEPVAAWVVEGASASESRFEAVRAAGLTDFIGRGDELHFLLERQRLAWKGEGQVVLISGEPGIGKSRLTAALGERIAGETYTRLRYQCSPYHINSALHPFIAQLERAAGFKADDTPEQRLDKLKAVLAIDGSRIEAVVPLFATLLAIPFDERYPPLALSPAQQRRRTLAALLDQFEGLARQQPILLSFEDAQWADATSLELLDLMVERVRQLPVLALFIFRPEFEPPWVGLPNVGTLTLGRLDSNDVENMIARVTGGRVLPAEVMKQIVTKTDGNPLFVEELTKTVLEAGILVENGEGYRLDGPLPPLAIPETLQDSLMARLDRLAPVREIAQIGAAIGREFSYPLVRAVAGRDESALKHGLAQLEQAGLLFRRGEPPDAVYSFKHALVRDAAYESLLKSRRQQLHGQIARTLEERFADILTSQPEIVAHHFTQAGLVDPAIDYWLKAGNLALSHSANAEAVKHLRQGIELTQSLAPSPDRARKELDFCLALGPAMAATEGYATPETLKVFSDARDLMGDGGTPTEQMTVHWGVYLAHSMRAENIAAREVAQQCLTLAAEHDHPGMSALANRFMGQTLWMMGAFVDARVHLERALELCAANQETITSYRRFGADDEVAALSALSRTLLILGYPEQAAAGAGQALARARSLGLAFTTALALDGEALLGALGNDLNRAAVHANEAMDHSIEHGLADYEQRARFIQGALLAQSGDPRRGIELMDSAIAALKRTQSANRLTLYLGHSAAAHASLGQPDLGLDLLDEAIQTADKMDERFFEVELYRLKGEILLMLNRRGEAETGLRQALTIAQQQQARWWELRAATSLAKHWHDEGKYLQAYSLLQPVYGWFVESFDAASLKAANTLLVELRDLSGPQAQARRG